MKSAKFWQNVNAASEVIPRILSGDSFEVKQNLRVGTDGIGEMTPRLCKRSADDAGTTIDAEGLKYFEATLSVDAVRTAFAGAKEIF